MYHARDRFYWTTRLLKPQPASIPENMNGKKTCRPILQKQDCVTSRMTFNIKSTLNLGLKAISKNFIECKCDSCSHYEDGICNFIQQMEFDISQRNHSGKESKNSHLGSFRSLYTVIHIYLILVRSSPLAFHFFLNGTHTTTSTVAP